MQCNIIMKKRIFYYNGNTQFENTGDLLINKTLLDIISSNGIIVINDEKLPLNYKNELLTGLDNIIKFSDSDNQLSFNKHIYLSLFKNFIFRKKEIFILENPGHHFSKLLKPGKFEFKDFLKRYLFKKLNCNVLKIGVTLGPYSDSMSVYYAKTSKYYHSIFIRDFKTLELTNKFNFKNITYMPDLAWAFNNEKYQSISKINIPNSKYIVISFRDAMEGSARDAEYFVQLERSLEKIFETYIGYKFVLSYQVVFDKKVCEDIFVHFKDSYDVTFIDECLNISDAMYLYSNSEMVISNRLHVLLLAIKSKTLAIALSDVKKHNKLVSMYHDENVKECFLDIYDSNFIINLQTTINMRQILLEKFDLIIKKNSKMIYNSINQIFKV